MKQNPHGSKDSERGGLRFLFTCAHLSQSLSLASVCQSVAVTLDSKSREYK